VAGVTDLAFAKTDLASGGTDLASDGTDLASGGTDLASDRTVLASARGPALWIGSVSGLWRLSADGALADRSPAPGPASRWIRRVITGDGFVAAATEAGAWVSADGRAWSRLSDGLPAGPVSAVAIDRSAPDHLSGQGSGQRTGQRTGLWLVVGRELWRAALVVDALGARLASARRVPVPGAPNADPPVDLLSYREAGGLAVLYPRSLAVRTASGAFRIHRPVLPPGATAVRIRMGAGRTWMATDQGLLHASNWAGPWRRSEAPAGSATVRALAITSEGDGLLVASPSGLLHGAPVLVALGGTEGGTEGGARGGAGGPPRAIGPASRPGPGIGAVHAATLRYLDLQPERMRGLQAGLDRRGWLPSLSLRLAAARDKSWGRDDDQSFTSGAMRNLRDRDKERNLDLEASVVMSWDLGALAFDDDAIDISREHRLIVSLRDNVLDEINQMYFERRSLLEKLDSRSAADPEAHQMSLRAAELAAGLDAWTGGWFSAQRRPDGTHHQTLSPSPDPRPAQETSP
jgi:hypothetical protein